MNRLPIVRVLLLDDHILFRESLGCLLSTKGGIEVASQCASIAEALDILSRDRVDVVLLELNLDSERGDTFLKQARAGGFKGHVLVVTAHASDEEALELIRSGISGILCKHSTPEQLTQAIRRVSAGERWLVSCAVEAFVEAPAGPLRQKKTPPPLTEREQRVLTDVLDGLGNKQIGDRLGSSESAVKSLLQQLFRKFGVRKRAQLVRVVLERRIETRSSTQWR
jgi:two-component system nitrate/nitrite response regulator NarL